MCVGGEYLYRYTWRPEDNLKVSSSEMLSLSFEMINYAALAAYLVSPKYLYVLPSATKPLSALGFQVCVTVSRMGARQLTQALPLRRQVVF